jgi:hypothetical protein
VALLGLVLLATYLSSQFASVLVAEYVFFGFLLLAAAVVVARRSLRSLEPFSSDGGGEGGVFFTDHETIDCDVGFDGGLGDCGGGGDGG